jgi:thioredoxin reductase
MIGTGNVGLIVSYQLIQAGANVVALIDAAPAIGGYGVHAAKIRRAGVPIYVSHTIKRAVGNGMVKQAEIIQLDQHWQPVPGTEKVLDVDTICLSVGLTPLIELASMVGCELAYISALGGHVPKHNANMETTIAGVYIAGDISGIEEASSAMEEGRLAGIASAEALGLYNAKQAKELKQVIWNRLNALRTGTFGLKRRQAKNQQTKSFNEFHRKDAKTQGIKKS